MKRWLLLLFCMAVGCLVVSAQRLFSFELDSLSRSYLVVEPSNEERTNLPLIILLHDEKTLPVTLAKWDWSKLYQPCLIVFPIALRNKWACRVDSDSVKADEKFLFRLIFHIQNNFRTDPSRVFIIGAGYSFCLADHFAKANRSIVRAAVAWKPWPVLTHGSITPERLPFDSLVRRYPAIAGTRNDSTRFVEQPKIQKEPYADHTTLAFHLGRWQQAKSSHVSSDSLILTDLAEYHFLFGLEVSYHFTERWSGFAGGDFIIIPKKREITSISWGGGYGVNVKASGEGSLVIPYGLGIRYTIPRENFRPFVYASAGATFLHIGGGKVTGGSGGIDKKIEERRESVFRYGSGIGFDLRASPMTSMQVTAHYTFSSKIEPSLASVDRFQGASFLAGLLFILNRK
jgi:hypothetical protein